MSGVLVLDSYAATVRANAAIGTDDGAGACLANVYRWFGGPAWSSVGPGAGKFARAIDAWNYAARKVEGIAAPPAGLPVYFGVDTPRTDKNAGAGDVGLSLGNGYGIFTDSPTGRPAIMAIPARARQIQRNYLGTTLDFLGHDTTAGLQYLGAGSAPAVQVQIKPPTTVSYTFGEDSMKIIEVRGNAGDPYNNDIVVIGDSFIYHTKDAAEAYGIGRSNGLFVGAASQKDPDLREWLRKNNLSVTPAQFSATLNMARTCGLTIKGY